MATWGDIVALVLTLAVFAGVIVGVMSLNKSVNTAITSTKSNLKEKGLNISDKGVTVKTNNRLTREDYIDGTQRAFINGIAAVKEAGSFGHADDIHRTPSSSPSMTARTSSKGSEHGSPAFNAVSRTDSFGSQKSDKKRSLFGGIRRKNST